MDVFAALKSLLIITLFVNCGCKPTKDAIGEENWSKKYMSHYGYFAGKGSSDKQTHAQSTLDSKQELSEAIKKYQILWNLKVTGVVDEETEKLMKSKRCGNSDEHLLNRKRTKRFAIIPNGGWNKNRLTYRISRYPMNDLTQTQVRTTISRAFALWAEVASLSFQEVTYFPDIDIQFATAYHGDGVPFDGAGGDLAHTFFPNSPLSGDAHFDDSERWTLNVNGGTDLLQVAVHEFGHALGLDHTRVLGAVMYPFYRYNPNFRLSTDDIEGMQYLYGRRQVVQPSTTTAVTQSNTRPTNSRSNEDDGSSSSTSSVVASSTRNSVNTRPTTVRSSTTGSPINFCGFPEIDAIVESRFGPVVYRGLYYALLRRDGIAPGYPRTIAGNLPGVPVEMNAAVFLPDLIGRRCYYYYYFWNCRRILVESSRTYFFKGSNYFTYLERSGRVVESGLISTKFPGIPDNVESVFTPDGGAKIQFIKGGQIWSMYRVNSTIEPGYPKPVSSVYGNLPSTIDAVFRSYHPYFHLLYFFSGTQYYRISQYRGQVDLVNPPYPRNTGRYWFDCQLVTSNEVSSLSIDDEIKAPEDWTIPDEIVIDLFEDSGSNTWSSASSCKQWRVGVYLLVLGVMAVISGH